MKHTCPPGFFYRLWVPCIVAVLVCSIWADRADAAGRTHRYGDVEITELDIPAATSWHGYVSYRFTVANRSKDANHTVRMWLPMDSYRGNVTVGQTVAVAPGAVTTVSLLQPPISMSGEDIGVEIDGKTKRPISFSPVKHGPEDYWDTDDNVPVCILVSKSLTRNLQDAKTGMEARVGGNSEISIENSDLHVSQWAGNWLAYSRYDAVIVSSDELTAMSSSARQAVIRYVACGGTLVVAGQFDIPKFWQDRHYQRSNLNHYTVGFGTCIIVPKNLHDVSVGQWLSLHESWQKDAEEWKSTYSVSDANDEFPIVENLRVPTGGLLAVMLAFVILAGPVNLTVLSRLRKRIWMFWTVPAISLVTCVSVFLYAFIAEGWDGHARTVSVTILHQRNHHAATIGWTAFYSPMTPGDGLHFGLETEVTPQWGQGDRYNSYGPSEVDNRGRLHTDWTSDQHLQGNWVNARIPAHFGVRKAETRRERLNVTISDDGSVTVVNGLGAGIEVLYLADATGRIHEAFDIAPGAQAVLTSRSKREGNTVAAAFTPDKSVGALLRTIPPYTGLCTARTMLRSLRPNCYVADLDGTPFIEDALDGAKQTKSQSVVYGIFGDSGGS